MATIKHIEANGVIRHVTFTCPKHGDYVVTMMAGRDGKLVGPSDECPRCRSEYFEEHRDFYALLNERGLIGLLKDVILELCGFRPDQEARAAYASAFAAYSLYGWVEVWFLRGMKESAQEMAELFAGSETA